MRLSVLALSLIAAVVGWNPQTTAADVPKKAYLVFPIRTELQRKVLFDSKEHYYLLVHGDGLTDKAGGIDPSRLSFHDLSEALGRSWSVQPGDRIHAELIFAKQPPKDNARMINLAILGWALDRGYQRHGLITIIGDYDWRKAVRLTGNARGMYPEKEKEDAVGDETVRVYPVRTALSRLRTGTDCVVSFPRPYGNNATGTLDDKTRNRVKKLVASLKLKKRQWINFAIRLTPDSDQKAVDRFTKKTARELMNELGFKEGYSVSCRYAK